MAPTVENHELKLSSAEAKAFADIRAAQLRAQQEMVDLTKSIFDSRGLTFENATNPVLADDFQTITWATVTEAEETPAPEAPKRKATRRKTSK